MLQVLECDTEHAGARKTFKLLKGIKPNSRPCVEKSQKAEIISFVFIQPKQK